MNVDQRKLWEWRAKNPILGWEYEPDPIVFATEHFKRFVIENGFYKGINTTPGDIRMARARWIGEFDLPDDFRRIDFEGILAAEDAAEDAERHRIEVLCNNFAGLRQAFTQNLETMSDTQLIDSANSARNLDYREILKTVILKDWIERQNSEVRKYCK